MQSASIQKPSVFPSLKLILIVNLDKRDVAFLPNDPLHFIFPETVVSLFNAIPFIFIFIKLVYTPANENA